MRKDDRIQVLFICTRNSARSQMAEGIFRRVAADIADVYSADIEPAADVHPLAKRVMRANGIDPSGHHPKSVKQYLDKEFDIIITTCDTARESCPFFPGDVRRYHWGLDDPSSASGNEEERLAAFQNTFADLSERIFVLMDVVEEMYNEKRSL